MKIEELETFGRVLAYKKNVLYSISYDFNIQDSLVDMDFLTLIDCIKSLDAV